MALDSQAAQFELILVDVPEEFNAGIGSCDRCEVLEAEHRPSSGLDAAMVLLDEVVQKLRRPPFRVFKQRTASAHRADGTMRSRIAIEGDRARRAALAPECLLEERFGCGHIALSAEPIVDGLASLIHGAIKIDPLAAYL